MLGHTNSDGTQNKSAQRSRGSDDHESWSSWVDGRGATRMSWLGKLHELQTETATRNRVDPWRVRLERVRGQVGDDGVERISTQTLFDHLEVFQRSRGAGASRRLAKIMREIGWTPVRIRDLTRGGYLEQVRGYARNDRHRN
jgi:hypothetical protein